MRLLRRGAASTHSARSSPRHTPTWASTLSPTGAMMTGAHGPGTFGALLHQHRLMAGLSQEELAERAGLSRRGISDLERGARLAPYPATVRRLIEALGLSRL